MAAQLAPGIASGVISVTTPTEDTAQHVLHFSNGSTNPWTTPDLTTLANTIDAWITAGGGGNNTILHPMQSSFVVSGITCRDLTVDGGAEYAKTVSHQGVDGGGVMNAGLSFALTLRTGLAGRSFRGRVFSIGLSAAAYADANTITSTVAGQLVAAWGALPAAIEGANGSWRWVVLSREHNKAPRAEGVGTPILTVGYSDLVVDYQRRRAPNHARHN